MPNQVPELDFSNEKNKIQFIRAGAGAGKTTTLISTCIAFVKQFKEKHNRYPKLIITTFTVKAKQEIQERLIIEALQTGDQELFEYFNKKSMVQIGTIHGVLNIFLSQNSEVIKLPASFKIVSDHILYFALKRFLKNIFSKDEQYQMLLDHLTFSKLVDVIYSSIHLKMQYADMAPVSKDVLLNTTSSSLKDILSVIDQFLQDKKNYPEKFNSGVEFLTQLKNAIQSQDYQAVLDAYENKPRKFTVTKKAPEISIELDEQIGKIYKEVCVSPLFFETYTYALAELHKIFDEILNLSYDFYETRYLSTGEISINELELLSLKIIQQSPETMSRFSKQYDFIMVDEYQDTSPLQVEILDHLMKDKFQFIVGDPQQSIYLFRGARSEVFLKKEAEINQLGYSTLFKMKNYRSHARLMSFINDFFARYSSQFQSMQTKNENFDERDFAEATFLTAAEESYAGIVQQIHDLHKSGVEYSDITVLFLKNKEILNFAKYANQYGVPVQVQISRGYEDKPEIIDLISLMRFLINPYDSENLIQLVRGPWFSLAEQEILDIRQISKATSEQNVETPSFWYQLKISAHPVYVFLKSIEDCYLQSGVSEALFMFLDKSGFFESMHYLDPSTQRESNVWKFIQTILKQESENGFNLSDFINNQFTQFNSDFSSSDGEGMVLTATNRVGLMTVHGSKGLQFKHVIIHGFNSQVKTKSPDFLTFDEKTHHYCLKIHLDEFDSHFSHPWAENVMEAYTARLREENDRVLYVAMTRAIDSLTLVREETKSIPKNSWLEKINWSEENYLSGQYKTIFKTIDEPIIDFKAREKSELIEIKPLSLNRVYSQSSGVTEIVSSTLDTVVFDNQINPSPKSAEQTAYETVSMYNKAQKGTDLHRYFEALKYTPIDEILETLNSENDKEALLWMLSQKEVDLTSLLENGYVEWGFGLKTVSKMIQGQIDVWGYLKNEVCILDYKTGNQKYLNKAFDQLQFYASCLKKMKMTQGCDVVKLIVVYPYDKHIETKTLLENEVELDILL